MSNFWGVWASWEVIGISGISKPYLAIFQRQLGIPISWSLRGSLALSFVSGTVHPCNSAFWKYMFDYMCTVKYTYYIFDVYTYFWYKYIYIYTYIYIHTYIHIYIYNVYFGDQNHLWHTSLLKYTHGLMPGIPGSVQAADEAILGIFLEWVVRSLGGYVNLKWLVV